MRHILTLLLVNGALDIEVNSQDDDVADGIEGAAGIEDVGVFEGDLLGELHHSKDDDQVGAVTRQSLLASIVLSIASWNVGYVIGALEGG